MAYVALVSKRRSVFAGGTASLADAVHKMTIVTRQATLRQITAADL
jgi:hypothetical protein